MNLHLCRVALRPRGPLEVFDLGLALLQAHPGVFFRMALLWVLPVAALGSALALLGYGSVAVWSLPVLFALVQAPVTLLTGRLLFAEGVRVRDVLRELARSPVSFGAAWLWQTGALALGLLCVGVGAMVSVPATIYVAEAALLEKVGALSSLRRSSRLASANLGNALVASVAWVGLSVWGALTAEAAGQSIVGFVLQFGAPFGALQEGDVTPFVVFGLVAAQPLFAVYKLLLYVDTRTRVEGWDLQVGLRAAGLGGT